MHDLDRLRSEMEELFSDLWQGRRLAGVRRAFRPAVDVYRTDVPPAVTVVCDLARVAPRAGALSVSRGGRSITGGRRGLRRPTAERWGMLRLRTVGRDTGEERISILGYPSSQGTMIASTAMMNARSGG